MCTSQVARIIDIPSYPMPILYEQCLRVEYPLGYDMKVYLLMKLGQSFNQNINIQPRRLDIRI